MRKYILAFLCAVILSNCEISTRQVNAARSTYEHRNFVDGDPSVFYETINGMEYMFLYTHYGGWTEVNLTKDSLECAYYKKHL